MSFLQGVSPQLIREAVAGLRERFGAEATRRVEDTVLQALQRQGNYYEHGMQRALVFVPGLRTTPFHDVGWYPELAPIDAAFKAAHPRIKDEVLARLTQPELFSTYKHLTLHDPNWKAAYFHSTKVSPRVLAATRAAFPETAKLVDVMLEHGIVGGEVHYSILPPGMHIQPHSDPSNFCMTLHFPITVPEGCSIRVGEETRGWREGECLLFDYTFNHEAWNRSAQARACLLVDIWNPELTAVERQAVDAIGAALTRAHTRPHARE
jgi:hypothetical protein